MTVQVDLDEAQLKDAEEFTGIQDRSELLQRALQALVHREASRRLAALGGTEPQLKRVPRRRSAL